MVEELVCLYSNEGMTDRMDRLLCSSGGKSPLQL